MVKASIILILLRWEEIVDLTSRCAVYWDGLARVGHARNSYILELIRIFPFKFPNSRFA